MLFWPFKRGGSKSVQIPFNGTDFENSEAASPVGRAYESLMKACNLHFLGLLERRSGYRGQKTAEAHFARKGQPP